MLYVSRREGDVLVRAETLRGVIGQDDMPADITERLAEDATQRAIVRLLTRIERVDGATMVRLRWADIEAELLQPDH